MPSFEIDLESPFAGHQLLSIMFWPSDLLARENYLVTTASRLIPVVEEQVPLILERNLQALASQAAALTGSSIEDIQARIKDVMIADRVAAAVSAFTAEIDKHLFRPSGGFDRVANAPGTDAIHKAAMNSGGKFGAACGEILVYIVALTTHHPDIKASLNRATHIMVERAKMERRAIPPERSRKTMWTAWGGVSPLWAAMALCETAAKSRGLYNPSLNDAVFRREVITASLWLADFAVGFEARGAKGRLLSDDKVVRLNCGLEAARPEIPALPDEQLAWGRAYRAPGPR